MYLISTRKLVKAAAYDVYYVLFVRQKLNGQMTAVLYRKGSRNFCCSPPPPSPDSRTATMNPLTQGFTRRCRLSWLTNRTLVYESKCGGMGGGGCGVSVNEYSCSHHVTGSPNKLWRSNSIFNLYALSLTSLSLS
jgi:hypothetical protein